MSYYKDQAIKHEEQRLPVTDWAPYGTEERAKQYNELVRDEQSCDCPACTALIWDRSTGYRTPLDLKPVPQPNRVNIAGVFWLAYALVVVISAAYFVTH